MSGQRIKKGNPFLNGVLVLSASTVICKILGMFFKIPILNLLGLEGMACFSAAYHLFLLFSTVASAGFPAAMTVLISRCLTHGDTPGADKVFRTGMISGTVLGLIGTTILYIYAEPYAGSVMIPGTAASVRAAAPVLFITCVSNILRGYYQGYGSMTQTAVSQLMESAGKLILGMAFAAGALRRGADSVEAAAWAMCGVSIGYGTSMLYLLLRRIFIHRRDPADAAKENSQARIFVRFWGIALPVSISAGMTGLGTLADTILIPSGLISGGLAESAAVAVYSSYTNLAIPVYNLSPALITPVAISVLPFLVSAISERNDELQKKMLFSAFRLCIFAAVPAGIGISFFSRQILSLIFKDQTEGINLSAPLLSVLALSTVSVCLITLTNAVLQAYGKPSFPIISMGVGVAVKLTAESLMLSTFAGAYGAPVSTLLSTMTVLLLNLGVISRTVSLHPVCGCAWKSLAASAAMAAVSLGIYGVLCKSGATAFAFPAALIAAIAAYIPAALRFGVLEQDDVEMLPGGETIKSIFEKTRLLPRRAPESGADAIYERKDDSYEKRTDRISER